MPKINTSKKSKSSRTYPYQNTDLADLPNEYWEDIPDLDGYFRVSNLGRIKRMEHERLYRNGAIYIKPEKIIKPIVVKAPNKFIGDYTCFLAIRVTLFGKRYNYTVARLVYYCFVHPFDLSDNNVLILTKDTNNFSIIPSNLIAATVQYKQQRVIIRKRFKSPLLDLPNEFLAQVRQKIAGEVSKQVTQYTLSGEMIKTFSSAINAQKETGIFSSQIGFIANGGGISAGGFIWRWGNAKKIELKDFKAARRKKHREEYGIKVTQYDMNGNRIAMYPSIKDAAEQTGIRGPLIGSAVRGVYKSAKGFYWKKGYGKEKIDLSDYAWGRGSMAITQSKKVIQYTLDGNYVHTFSSIKEAAEFIRVSSATLSSACRGKQKTCGGYKWRFAKKNK